MFGSNSSADNENEEAVRKQGRCGEQGEPEFPPEVRPAPEIGKPEAAGGGLNS